MADSRIKDTNYFQISGWMINKLELKGIQLELYAIIYGFSQDGESEFTGSIKYLCDFTGTSRPTVSTALKSLVEKEYIIKKELEVNGIKFNRYKVNLQVVNNFTGSKKTLQGSKKTLQGSKDSLQGSKEILHNNNIYNKDNNKNNNKYKDIIEYLNLKANTNYKHTTKSTQSKIDARIKEGFTVEDFKTVIDKKCAEWLNDNKMNKYLRPETLFGTKFESYLNAKEVKTINNSYSKNTNLTDLDDIF